MKTTFIYALCEPGSKIVRYVGKTKHFKRRFRQHLLQSQKRKSHLGCWVRSLLASNEAPVMILLKEVPDEEWEKHEIEFIRRAKEMGFDLVNACDGGIGGRGRVFSDSHRESLRRAKLGKKFSESHKHNHAEAMLKLRGPNNPQFGKPISEERRRAQSKAMSGENHWCFGTKLSFETKAKISNSHLGLKPSEETRAKMRAAWVRRKARKENS